jgi:hypothetical protein
MDMGLMLVGVHTIVVEMVALCSQWQIISTVLDYILK